MARLSEKIKASGILYKYGFTTTEICQILGLKSPKQIITHLRKEKIEQEFKEKQLLKKYSTEELDFLTQVELLDTIQNLYPHLLIEDSVTKIEIPQNFQFFESETSIDTKLESETKNVSKYDSEVARFKRLINNPDINNVCSVCENKGFIYLPNKDGSVGVKSHICPKCKGNSVHNKVTTHTVEIDTDELEEYIPNKRYRDIDFDLTILNRSVDIPQEMKDKVLYKDYEQLLDRFITDFKNGKLPVKSYMLSAPDGFGKKYFIYQCIKECLSYGYVPSKLLDIVEIQDMFNNYKFNELISLFNVDILFIDLSGGTKFIIPDTYKYILNTCDRQGIPVIFVSRSEQATIIQQRFKNTSIDWYDIFKEDSQTFDYDYGHIVNIGITGFFARDLYQYRKNAVNEFIKYSPMRLKSNTISKDNEELVDYVPKRSEDLLIDKRDLKKEENMQVKPAVRTKLEIENNIDM